MREGTVNPVSEPREMRVGNDERERAVRALGDHFVEGRLDPDEFDERTARACAARTTAELDALFADLPRPAPSPAARPPGPQPDPYGREPITGLPYSDRSKVIAGLLQLVLPFGIGRFYSGHIGIGVAQLVLSFFVIGVVWAFIDGIVILAGRPTDPYGRPLRP
jgi:hypothetical protein